jgi:peptide/nickel transport system substrate-binding protein
MRKFLPVLLALALFVFPLGCTKRGADHADGAPDDDGSEKPPVADGSGAPPAVDDPVALAMQGTNPEPVVDAVVTDGGTLVRRLNAEPGTLNPLTYRDYYAGVVLDLTHDNLAARNPDTLEWEGRLAESWQISDDNLTITFKLRRDVKWHDGTPFTAADIIYSFSVLKDPDTPAPRIQNYYNDLAEIVAPDDYTVEFRWTKPYFKCFEESAGMPIFARHVFDTEADFSEHPAGRRPVGNGMFVFKEWKTNEHIILDRNEEYYGRKPHIKRLVLRFVPDDNTALLLAGSGEVDYMGVRAEQWVKEVADELYREKFNRYYYYVPTAGFSYIGWNEKRPFFADKLVRRAMTHAVQREAVRKEYLYGLAEIVTGPFYIKAPAYDAAIEPYEYDLAAAQRLLDEADWVDGDDDGLRDKIIDGERVKFSFAFMIPSGSKTGELIAVLLQEDLRKLGIEMDIRQLEWSTFEQQLTNGNFDAVTLAWTGTLDGDPYQIWHSSQRDGGSNYIGFANSEADGIIEAARTEFDADKRNAMYRRFHAILHDEQPYTFLYTQPNLAILDKRFHNVVIHKLGTDTRDWYVLAGLQKAY